MPAASHIDVSIGGRSFFLSFPKTQPIFQVLASAVVDRESYPRPALEAAAAAMGGLPESDQRKLKLFLGILEWWALFACGRKLSRLSKERAAVFLEGMARHRLAPLRQGIWGLKTFALMGYYGTELAWGELRYPGPRKDLLQLGDRHA